MQFIKKFGILFSLLPGAVVAQSPMQTNPMLVHSNQPEQFGKFSVANIKSATATLFKISDERIHKITAIPASKKTVANTLMAVDELEYDINDLGAKLSLVASTYSDDASRDEANTQLQALSSYSSDLFLNEPLYKALKSFSATSAGKLSATQKKFLKEALIAFEVNGMKLDANGRQKLKGINDKIIDFGNQFDKNLAEFKDSIEFTLPDLAGIPGEYTAAWKRPNDKYMLRINGPNYINVENTLIWQAPVRPCI